MLRSMVFKVDFLCFITKYGTVADLGGVQRFPWNPPFWLSPLYKSYGSRLVLDFMEPSLPSSYKKTLALAYLRVILNEYWSIGKPWARSSTMQRIRSCASFIKVGVANAQMGVALNPPLANPRSATVAVNEPIPRERFVYRAIIP